LQPDASLLAAWTLFSFWLFVFSSKEQVRRNFDSQQAHLTLNRAPFLCGYVENAAWIALALLTGDLVTLLGRIPTFYMDHVLDWQIVLSRKPVRPEHKLWRDYAIALGRSLRTIVIATVVVELALVYFEPPQTKYGISWVAFGMGCWSLRSWVDQLRAIKASGGRKAEHFSLRIPYAIVFCTAGWLAFEVFAGHLGILAIVFALATLIVHVWLIFEVTKYRRQGAFALRLLDI
jgi:hypothetical protein